MNFVRKYVLLVLFTSLSSNFTPEDSSLIPKPIHEPIAWQGLTDLRNSLLERGMLNEALALFKVERTRLPPIERADATISFRDHVTTRTLLTEERSAWVGVELQICFARSLYERQEIETGRLEFIKAEELLHRWCVLSGNQSIETLTPYLDIKLFQLGLLADDDPVAYFTESVNLLEIMKSCCHTSTAVCYGHATDAARALDIRGFLQPYRTRFFQLHREREMFQKTIQEDIRGLLFSQRVFFDDALNGLSDSLKALEWVDDFMEQNKDFNAPNELHTIHTWRKTIWGKLGDLRRVEQATAEIGVLESSIAQNKGVLLGVRRQNFPSAVSSVDSDSRFEIEFPLDLDENNYLNAWSGLHGDYDATCRKAMKLLLQWLSADVQTGTVRREQIQDLTGLRIEAEDDETFLEKLKALSFDDIFATIYLQDTDPAQVLELSAWETRFERLRTWLIRPVKSERNGRQYLMTILQEIRKDNVAHSQAPLSVKIFEIERCFSILDDLTPKVKEFVATKIPKWYTNIAVRYWMFCIESKDFDSEEVGEALNKAEPAYKQSITLEQEKGGLLEVAMVRKMAAQLCVFKLNWLLRRPGKSMSDPELLELQTTGLDFLEKAESFFESRHQTSTWANDLEGLEARERANLVGNSWELPRIAMMLLDAGNVEPNEEIRIQMWIWVQRSKARSLAMTMGIAGIMPLILLKKISASEKCRLLYEKMISLQQQIQSTEPHKRFWLRRDLDIHVTEMRKEEPLREVCDLWDGKPLSFRDIDRITALTGSPLLLVDWFHVPGVFDDGKLLLLTARSESTPTVKSLSIKLEDVALWVRDFLDDSRFAPLRAKSTDLLGDLVQPLLAQTQPGETLVFCPTSILHRVPLHAIMVEGMEGDSPKEQPLIYRNPIVYSHSHSLLRVCLWNSQIAAEIQAPLNPLIMNGIPQDVHYKKFQKGRESVQTLALDFGVQARLDENATKSEFLQLAPTSRLIHVHSHVNWDEKDPLSHHIKFSNSSTTTTAGDEGRLTARELFSLSVPKGSHISLIACSGGRVRNESNDEVLGLVPALLRAGATSTISTLWKIPDPIGAGFSEAFYASFLKQRNALPETGGGVVDIAKAFRDAVMRLKDERRHWSSFVVHGFWSFFVPGKGAGRG